MVIKIPALLLYYTTTEANLPKINLNKRGQI